jgi:hypothetical protein
LGHLHRHVRLFRRMGLVVGPRAFRPHGMMSIGVDRLSRDASKASVK